MTRNLLMYVLPVAGNPMWRWNLSQVIARAPLFNGRRILAVAEDDRLPTDSLDEVARIAAPLGAELLPVRNNRNLREAAVLPELLERVQSDRDDEATFFCHAKGVTRGVPVQGWTERMYEVLLDQPERLDAMLRDSPIVGAFRRFGHFPILGDVTWHYPGTFYWFRHYSTFSRGNWRDVPQTSHGAEAWPAVVFDADEAGVAGEDNVGDLYPPARPTSIPMTTPEVTQQTEPRYCGRANSGVAFCWGVESTKPRDVIVCGPARSGTTMMAELLSGQLGLPIVGEGTNREPAGVYRAIDDRRWDDIAAWITDHRPPAGPWGFKMPRLLWHLDHIRPALVDPLLIVMLRDPLAIAIREHLSIGMTLDAALERAIAQHSKLLNHLRTCRLPAVLVSFEKLKESPAGVVEQLRPLLAGSA